MNQSVSEVNTSKEGVKFGENVSEQVMIGFGFTSDWLRKWSEHFSTYQGA